MGQEFMEPYIDTLMSKLEFESIDMGRMDEWVLNQAYDNSLRYREPMHRPVDNIPYWVPRDIEEFRKTYYLNPSVADMVIVTEILDCFRINPRITNYFKERVTKTIIEEYIEAHVRKDLYEGLDYDEYIREPIKNYYDRNLDEDAYNHIVIIRAINYLNKAIESLQSQANEIEDRFSRQIIMIISLMIRIAESSD